MFVDFHVPALRVFALLSHFLLTTGLYWTKFDSLQVSMADFTDNHEYKVIDTQYTGLMSFGLIALLAQTAMLLTAPDTIELGSMLHLAADCAACFWISWIILDGLDWRTYIYIFVFCVVLPLTYDILVLLQSLLQKKWTSWRKPESLAVTIYYACFRKYRECFRRR